VAVSQSASGAVFLSTDVSPNIETVTSTTTTTCLAEAKLATLIESVRVGASGAQGADVDYVGTFAGGDEHTVVMDENGKLWSWGNGIYGQLGNGAFVRNQAQRVAVLSDLTFTQVTASTYHTAAIDSTGHLWTWGVNTYGQLGIQPYLDKSHTPIAVRPDLIFTQVTAGYGHTVALDNTGQLWSWGLDNMGQLGNDLALQTYNVPVKVLEGRKFKQVSTGDHHTVALETTGELWSWGRNTNGQLGLGDRTNRPTPAKVAFAPVIDKVATGDRHTVVLDSTGKLWSWGYDEYGQLGDDATKLDQTIPKAVLSGTKFKDVAGGMFHTVAIDTTGKLWSWGWDSNGQLGDGISEPGDKPTPVAVVFEPALPDLVFSHVTAGARHTLAMDNTGQLWSWGLDNTGQLGDDAALVSKSNPVKVTVW
jgi:alpha-tubulin suppressor-like RCC1 family protein